MQAQVEAEAEARRLAIADDEKEKVEKREKKKLKDTWDGWYQQGGDKHDMKFDVLKIKKKKIKGEGHDEVGQFKINGRVNHDEVEFSKEYVGKHTVEYSGKLEGHTLSGNWSIASFGMQD